MSSISSLTSQTSSSGATNPQQSLDNQIQALEARIKDAADAGFISQDQATDLTQQLDTIQKTFDKAATSGTANPSDYRQIQRQLHQIARSLLQANQATMADNIAQAAIMGIGGGGTSPQSSTDPLTGAPSSNPSTTTPTDPLLDPNQSTSTTTDPLLAPNQSASTTTDPLLDPNFTGGVDITV